MTAEIILGDIAFDWVPLPRLMPPIYITSDRAFCIADYIQTVTDGQIMRVAAENYIVLQLMLNKKCKACEKQKGICLRCLLTIHTLLKR